ncbi:MAG TPA: ATP-dependent zinc protease [Gammaproteobacteria bacterium]|nr:ATP-dependent zinc protease [Gammaproteobacteria bacterium]
MAEDRGSKRRASRGKDLLVFGWREWVELPSLGAGRIKAKIDTGARTSALHVTNLHSTRRDGEAWARFDVQPLQRRSSPTVRCEAPVIDHREVRNSGGQIEHRVVVHTLLSVAGHEWPIELTLTDRRDMRFRMLLGRTALRGHGMVNPGKSFLFGKPER